MRRRRAARPDGQPGRRFLIGAVALLLALGVVALAVRTAPPPARLEAAHRFLQRYVDPDGRVVRRDQGGDTVSEGQAYALLLAAGVGDARRFAAVWEWTRRHLQREDGLFAWHWQDGRVVDHEAAADADLDMARALLAGAERFDQPEYTTDAELVAAAVRQKETAVIAGRRLLLPGPAAAAGGSPAKVNPSYFAPRTFALLGWDDMAGAARKVASQGRPPLDWVLVDGDGRLEPAGPYGYEAARVPVRLAESPDPADRERAASMWPALRDHPFTKEHPVGLVGAAAAAAAAGEVDAARRLVAEARRRDVAQPTYYGGAWVALADLWLGLEKRR